MCGPCSVGNFGEDFTGEDCRERGGRIRQRATNFCQRDCRRKECCGYRRGTLPVPFRFPRPCVCVLFEVILSPSEWQWPAASQSSCENVEVESVRV